MYLLSLKADLTPKSQSRFKDTSSHLCKRVCPWDGHSVDSWVVPKYQLRKSNFDVFFRTPPPFITYFFKSLACDLMIMFMIVAALASLPLPPTLLLPCYCYVVVNLAFFQDDASFSLVLQEWKEASGDKSEISFQFSGGKSTLFHLPRIFLVQTIMYNKKAS